MKYKFVLVFLFLPVVMFAQEPVNYWGRPAAFMEEQTRQTFDLVKTLLKESPPSVKLSPIRQSALLHLDWIFHDPRLDSLTLTQDFLVSQVRNVVKELNQPVKKGVKVFKMYNHAFIVKSPTVTIAFDLTRGGDVGRKRMISDKLMDSVVKRCDILFVSHIHGDHTDLKVADLFIKNKKNIVATTGIWMEKGAGVQHIRSEGILKEKISLSSGQKINVTVMPGHQGDVPNNVYIVTTPEGISVAQTGDEFNEKDFSWIDQVKNNAKVDILLIQCWAMSIGRTVDGFDPKVVITGHENEIVHSIDHREPYWLDAKRLEKVTKPIVYMTWGESYNYRK